VHLGGQKFQTDDELKWGVLNWLYGLDKPIYAVGIGNLKDNGKIWGGVKGEYLEEELQFGDSGMYIFFCKKSLGQPWTTFVRAETPSYVKHIVTCRGVLVTKWRVLIRMIGFISTSATTSLNYTQS
jgi:hypothetical protein